MTILPHELYENILSHTDDVELWKSWSLVTRAFCPSAQRLLFEVVSVRGPLVPTVGSQGFLHTKIQLLGIFPPAPYHAYVIEISVALEDVEFAELENQLGEVLALLTNLRSLNLHHYSNTSWPLISSDLRINLIEKVFPRLRILGLHGIFDIPFLTILSTSQSLCHLSTARYAGSVDDRLIEGILPNIQSVTLDLDEIPKFMEDLSLTQVFPIHALESVKALALVDFFCGTNPQEGFLADIHEFLSGFASNLTHLHIGPSIYGKITDLQGSPIDHLPLSIMVSLEILQFEVADKPGYWSMPIFAEGYFFFGWLAIELLDIHPKSMLSQIICDLNRFQYNPQFSEGSVWEDLDQLLGGSSVLPHFEKFRLRLNRPSSLDISKHLGWLRAALPLCAAQGFVTVETWKDPKAMINSAIEESCSVNH